MSHSQTTTVRRIQRQGLATALCLMLLGSLGVATTSATPISAGVKAPSKPVIKVSGDYWGISIYFTAPSGSAAATAYQYSVDKGKTWKTTSIPYAHYAGKRGTTYSVLARLRNPGGASPAASARATHKSLSQCTSGSSCARIPAPTAYIRMKSQYIINIGSSLKVRTETNIDPTYDASGSCEVSAVGVVKGISAGLCEVYVYGYGDFIRNQGFAQDSFTVIVRPKGTATGSNSILANDFSCGLPRKPSGVRAGKSFLQSVSSTKTSITLYVGAPTNADAADVTCYDYSIDGARTWHYAVDTKSTGAFTIGGLSSKKSYKVVVRAIGKAGSGVSSNAVVIKTN